MKSILDTEAKKILTDRDRREASSFAEASLIVMRIASFVFIGLVLTHHMAWFDATAITLTLILALKAHAMRSSA